MGNKQSDPILTDDIIEKQVKRFIKEDKTSYNYITELRKTKLNNFNVKRKVLTDPSNMESRLNSKSVIHFCFELYSNLVNREFNLEINSSIYNSLTIPKVNDNNSTNTPTFDFEFLENQSLIINDWLQNAYLLEKYSKYENWIPCWDIGKENLGFDNLEQNYSSIRKDNNYEDYSDLLVNKDLSLERDNIISGNFELKNTNQKIDNKRRSLIKNKSKDKITRINLKSSIPEMRTYRNTIANGEVRYNPSLSPKIRKHSKIRNKSKAKNTDFDLKTVNSILNIMTKNQKGSVIKNINQKANLNEFGNINILPIKNNKELVTNLNFQKDPETDTFKQDNFDKIKEINQPKKDELQDDPFPINQNINFSPKIRDFAKTEKNVNFKVTKINFSSLNFNDKGKRNPHNKLKNNTFPNQFLKRANSKPGLHNPKIKHRMSENIENKNKIQNSENKKLKSNSPNQNIKYDSKTFNKNKLPLKNKVIVPNLNLKQNKKKNQKNNKKISLENFNHVKKNKIAYSKSKKNISVEKTTNKMKSKNKEKNKFPLLSVEDQGKKILTTKSTKKKKHIRIDVRKLIEDSNDFKTDSSKSSTSFIQINDRSKSKEMVVSNKLVHRKSNSNSLLPEIEKNIRKKSQLQRIRRQLVIKSSIDVMRGLRSAFESNNYLNSHENHINLNDNNRLHSMNNYNNYSHSALCLKTKKDRLTRSHFSQLNLKNKFSNNGLSKRNSINIGNSENTHLIAQPKFNLKDFINDLEIPKFILDLSPLDQNELHYSDMLKIFKENNKFLFEITNEEKILNEKIKAFNYEENNNERILKT